MKAAVLEDIERLKIADLDDPAPEDGGLVIKVAACAVCGTDVKIYHHGHRLIRFPRVTGHEISGTVEAVGRNVQSFRVGDRVAVAPAVPCGECRYCVRAQQTMCDNLTAIGYHYNGGFAEYMAVPPVALRTGCVNKVPEGMSFEEAAIAEPLACCINGQELSRVGLGQSVAILGAGPIGCFHVRLARCSGATKVMLLDISADRLKMAGIADADAYVDTSREDGVGRVMEETGGLGADVVITACSSGAAQEQALQMVAKRGVVDFFGGLPKDKPHIRFDSNLVHYREFCVVGNHGASPRHNALAIDLIASGKIQAKDLITHRFPIEETREGIRTTEKALGLKVVIRNE